MVTTILIATTFFLAFVLGFILYAKYVEAEKHKEEKRRRYTSLWKTVFERTDLRKAS